MIQLRRFLKIIIFYQGNKRMLKFLDHFRSNQQSSSFSISGCFKISWNSSVEKYSCNIGSESGLILLAFITSSTKFLSLRFLRRTSLKLSSIYKERFGFCLSISSISRTLSICKLCNSILRGLSLYGLSLMKPQMIFSICSIMWSVSEK